MIDAQLQSDLNRVVKTLKNLEPFVRRSGKEDLREAAKILSTAVAIRAPVGKKKHSRYAKLGGRRKAAKGSGNPIATYKPGNLKKSIRVLNFRRSSSAWVGAKVGKTPDGYYAHMVERGTQTYQGRFFFKAAIASAGGATLNKAIQLISKRIATFGANNGFK